MRSDPEISTRRPGEAANPLRVAFWAGTDDDHTRRAVAAIGALPGVEPVAILEGGVPTRSQTRPPHGRGPWTGWQRAVEALQRGSDAALQRAAASPDATPALLRRAFPQRYFSLTELAERRHIRLHIRLGRDPKQADEALRESGATLLLAVRVCRSQLRLLNLPPRGCLYLDADAHPESAPPGFWEVFDGAPSAHVAVLWLQPGGGGERVLGSGTVDLAAHENPDSLGEKLRREGERQLVKAVGAVRDGAQAARAGGWAPPANRGRPTRRQIASLRRRLPFWQPRTGPGWIGRNCFHLSIYYLGVYAAVRGWRRLQGRSRGAILLYHRVNDYARDALTVHPEAFASQLLAVQRRYAVLSTMDLVARVRSRQRLPPTAVAVHFDDCYRDILSEGAPILAALGIPACAFINSGFVGTDRTFAHDAASSPFAFPNLGLADLQTWAAQGFEVGAHTVNHVNLGQCPPAEATAEIVNCGAALAAMVEQPVRWFAFPYGRPDNISGHARRAIMESGYEALFSAHGGFVRAHTEPDDIPRIGCGTAPAVYCLLQIEGLTLSQLAAAWRRKLSGRSATARTRNSSGTAD